MFNCAASVHAMTTLQSDRLQLHDVMNALPAAVYTTDADGRVDHYNQAAVDLWGREPDRSNEFWCGSLMLFHPDGRPMPHDDCPMARALKSGSPIRGEEAVTERPDGSRVHFRAYPTPLRDATGAITGAVNMLLDITVQKAAETEIDRRILQMKVISELGMLALSSDDLQSLFDQAVLRLSEALDVEFTKVLELQPDGRSLLLRAGFGWKDAVVGQASVSAGLESQAGYTLSVNHPVIVYDLASETRFSGPELLLSHNVVSGMSTIILGEREKPYGVLGVHTKNRRRFTSHDIHLLQSVANILSSAHERHVGKNRQATLVSELSHRVKNHLSVIQSIARQTGLHAGNIEEFRCSFEKRIVALAHAQKLLTDSEWNGVSLGKLANLVLGTQIEENCLELNIEDIELSPSGTQAVTMVLHELMTNSAKYGALSCADGKVIASARCEPSGDDSRFRFTWREVGGPAVEKPICRGFGSKLIEATIQGQCGGKLDTDWRREGLVVDCTIPLSSIIQQH